MRYHLNTSATLALSTGFLGRLRGHFMPRPTPLVAQAVLDGPDGITPRIRLALDGKGRPEIVLGGYAATAIGPTMAQFVRAEIREKGSGRPFRLRVRGETVAEVAEMGDPASVLDMMAQAETLTGPSGSLTARVTTHDSATTPAGGIIERTTTVIGEKPGETVVTGDLFDRLAVPRKGVMIAARDVADAGMARLEIMAQEADDEAERLTTAAGTTSSAKRGRDYAARSLEFTERARLLRASARQTGALEWMAMERPDKAEAGFIRWQASSFGEWARVRMPPWCDAIAIYRDHHRNGTPEICDGVTMLPHQLYQHAKAALLAGYPEGTRLVVIPFRYAHRVWLPRDESSAG